MKLNFKKLELSDKNLLKTCVNCQQNIGWESSFGMIWAWDVFDETKICITENVAYLYNIFYGKAVFFPPFVRDKHYFAEAVDNIAEFCDQMGWPMILRGATAEYAGLLSTEKYEITPDRNNFDYIYSAEDLRELRGKKFHAKRNYVTRFEAAYPYSVREYTDDDFFAIMALYNEWYVKSVHETLDVEKKAIERALKNHRELDLKISVLFSQDKLIAFSVNSIAAPRVAHTFFEKGDINYVGVYQAINKYNANMFFGSVELVNRQEDMGIEGLRKVKLSYNPVMLLEKFEVTKKQ